MGNNFCSNCGAPLNSGANFCSGCGAKINTVTPAVNEVRLAVPSSFRKGLLSMKGCTLVFTDSELLVAMTDKDLMNKHMADVREQSKGKGFMKKTAEVMKAGYTFSDRYNSMSAVEIMAENRDNFRLPYNGIQSVRYKRGTVSYGADDTSTSTPPSLALKTTAGKYMFTFSSGYMSKDLIAYLNSNFAGRYKGPKR